MAIKIRNLRSAASRSGQVVIVKSFNEAIARSKQTAFLCHSHKDRELAKGLQVLLAESDWDVYIDWEDTEMPSTPSIETAKKIKSKIKSTDWFLFLATVNSTSSRWCPWEIGYADAIKHRDNILVVPTEDDYGNWYGNEYLQLYKKIDEGHSKVTRKSGYAVFDTGSNGWGTWVENL